MSKAITSYFDWESKFRKVSNSKQNPKSINDSDFDNDNFNSLGISDESFKDFMKKWKEKNL
ncbi:MAG: hypothetical protein ACFFAH_01145 [Promethearchaeota archaeon]